MGDGKFQFELLLRTEILVITRKCQSQDRKLLAGRHSQTFAMILYKLRCPSPPPSPHRMGRGRPSGQVRGL
jgi:hypothetical protein